MPEAEATQEHFSASHLRSHTWDRLKLAVSELVAARSGKKEAIAQVAGLLERLDVMEQYWAFPGRDTVRQLRALLERKDHTALEARTLKLVRTLVSGQVRLHAGEEPGPDQEEDNEERPRSKYFEVLFVDDLDAQEEMQLKRDLAEARDASDAFVYDAIVVPTVQDALIALLFNPNIQACVVRYGMPYASAQAKGFLRDYIRAIRDLDPGDLTRADMGPLLGKILRWFRPEVDRYYVTDTPVGELKDTTVQNFRRIFYRRKICKELHLTILRGIQETLRDTLLHRAKGIQQKADGCLPRHADLARQLGVQEPLDPGFRRVLRAQPVPCGDKRQHGGRSGFTAATHRSAEESATGARCARLRIATPSSPPTAPAPPTRSWCRHWWSPVTWS
jgi:arginine decarboxylase